MQLEIYDTTLRDGTQGYGVNLSLIDKLALTEKLDELGVAYIEGGWPGSNPKDRAYFEEAQKIDLKHAKISAFGSTRRSSLAAHEDPNLQALVQSGASVLCIFGKSWDLHIKEALRVTPETNLRMIAESIEYLRAATGRPVFYDAEHFFDGFKDNREIALATLQAAFEAGAERLVLCDTNGGSLPEEIILGVREVRRALPRAQLGIHVHNDGGLAVANSLAAIQAGCVQVQGTINGVGERCGNVDLTSVIANCELKLGLRCLPEGKLASLTSVSRYVWERMNRVGADNQPYVGHAAFAHKGGVHVSAMQRNERTYEHVRPESVGNQRRVLVSEMAGRSTLLAKLEARHPDLRDEALLSAVLEQIQDLEHEGYSYEAADASFDLLVRRHSGSFRPVFELDYYRVHGIGTAAVDRHLPSARRPSEPPPSFRAQNGPESAPWSASPPSTKPSVPPLSEYAPVSITPPAPRGARAQELVEATVKLRVGGETRLCVAEGNGPVDALSHALHHALEGSFPVLARMTLTDYSVRVVNSADGTGARVRVLIEHEVDRQRFSTVGVHANIIEASWRALVDAIDYAAAVFGR
ncbi:MAG: citramalate synthase [Polyangiaceae bacterium]